MSARSLGAWQPLKKGAGNRSCIPRLLPKEHQGSTRPSPPWDKQVHESKRVLPFPKSRSSGLLMSPGNHAASPVRDAFQEPRGGCDDSALGSREEEMGQVFAVGRGIPPS